MKATEMGQTQETPTFRELLEQIIDDRPLEHVAVQLNKSVTCIRYWLSDHSCPYPKDAEDLAPRMKKPVKVVRAAIVRARALRAESAS